MRESDAYLEPPMASDEERLAGPLVLSAVVPLGVAVFIETAPAAVLAVVRLIDRDWLAIAALLSLFIAGWGWILRGQLRGFLVMVSRVPFVFVMLSSLAMQGESTWGDTCVGSDTIDPGCIERAEHWFEFAFAGATAIPLISALLLWRSQREEG